MIIFTVRSTQGQSVSENFGRSGQQDWVVLDVSDAPYITDSLMLVVSTPDDGEPFITSQQDTLRWQPYRSQYSIVDLSKVYRKGNRGYAVTSIKVTILLEGDEVIIESNGMPNHTSPYWSSTNERTLNGPMGPHTTPEADQDHPLFVEPTSTSFDQMAPGNIDDFTGSFSLTIPVNPERASVSCSPGRLR